MIVLVEDNAELRYIYQLLFEMRGLKLTAYADGETAMARLMDGESPRLVILDINLPDIDGLTLLDTIRHTPSLKAVPVIMNSAQVQWRNESMKRGADAFIAKGVDDIDHFMKAVHDLLNGSSVRRDSPPN